MKKLLAIFLLVAGLVAMVLPLFGQAIQFTAAVPHTNGTPSGTPSTQGSRLRYDKTNQILYQWTGSTWTRVVGVVTDADKGDITVSSSGTNWQLDAGSVGNTEIASGAGGIYKGDGSVSGTTTATVPGSLRFNTGATGLVTLGDYGSVGLGSRLTVQSSGAQLGSASYEFRAQPDDTYTQMISPGYTVRLEPTTGYTLIQSGATNGYKFWDARATPRGVEYNTDYSATYSDRSLVDFGTVKALVSDSLAAAFPDGDKGDITVSSSGTNWQLDANVIDSTHIANGTISPDDLAQRGASVGQVMTYTSNGWRAAAGGGSPSVETLSEWTADADDVSVSSGTTTLRVSGDNGIRALTSINASGMTSGREFNILNVGTQPVVLQAQHPDGTSGNKFDIGQDVVLAPKASCRAIYDGTSAAFRVIADGAKTQRKFGLAIVAGSATASDWQDLQFQFDGGGTMTAFAPTSTLPAALSATTGASSTSDAYVIASKGVNGLFTHGLGYSYFRTVVTIPTLSDGTQGFYTLHGWYNAGSNPPNTSFANTVVIAYSHSDNSGKWVGYSADNAGSVSTVDLGVTVAANTPYTLEIYTNKQNTESRFFVDGVYKGRITANRPTSGVVMMPISGISKTIGSTSRSVYVHEVEYWGVMAN